MKSSHKAFTSLMLLVECGVTFLIALETRVDVVTFSRFLSSYSVNRPWLLQVINLISNTKTSDHFSFPLIMVNNGYARNGHLNENEK